MYIDNLDLTCLPVVFKSYYVVYKQHLLNAHGHHSINIYVSIKLIVLSILELDHFL